MPCVTGFVSLVLKGPCLVICDADFLIASPHQHFMSTLHLMLSHVSVCN